MIVNSYIYSYIIVILFDSECKIRMPKAKTKLNCSNLNSFWLRGKSRRVGRGEVLLVYYDNPDLYDPPWAWAFCWNRFKYTSHAHINWQSLAKDPKTGESEALEAMQLLLKCPFPLVERGREGEQCFTLCTSYLILSDGQGGRRGGEAWHKATTRQIGHTPALTECD